MENFIRLIYEAATGTAGSYLPVVICRAMPTSTFPSKKDVTNNIWLLNKDAVDNLADSTTWAGVLAELTDLKQQLGCTTSDSDFKKFACVLTAVRSMICFKGNVNMSGKDPLK